MILQFKQGKQREIEMILNFKKHGFLHIMPKGEMGMHQLLITHCDIAWYIEE